MLDDIRVLEISAPETMLAGQILADLGADVVTVEPPGGAPGRRLEPFLGEVPGLERSLAWHALNRNKRGITVDLAQPDGQALLLELAARYDALLWSGRGPVANFLQHAALPPAMIRCAVRPFSEHGPKSAYAATDLVLMASTGIPGHTGDTDRPPVFFPVPQSIMEAGAEAAIAVLAALAARDRDGLGQSVGVSARIAAMMGALSLPLSAGSGDVLATRTGGRRGESVAGIPIPSMYECADGHVLVSIVLGPAFSQMTARLAEWVRDEGELDPSLAATDWVAFPRQVEQGTTGPAPLVAFIEAVRRLCLRKTKAEVTAAARERGFFGAPVMTMADIAASPQYRARGLFAPVALPGAPIDAPARFARFSNYSIEIRRPAPALSQHTAEILVPDAGLSPQELQALFVHGIV